MNKLRDGFGWIPYGHGRIAVEPYYRLVRWKIDDVRGHMQQPLRYHIEGRRHRVDT